MERKNNVLNGLCIVQVEINKKLLILLLDVLSSGKTGILQYQRTLFGQQRYVAIPTPQTHGDACAMI